ncbi:MAG: hypothetical protein MZU84_04410 [Sphingobacterium sp.]|nr:hypothetical protein [Sphingobacterium sp.]
MLDGHFDFGNGYHGRVYLNPHQLFRYPSTIWRFAQDLIELMPASIVEDADVVAGPVTGGALLAHTIAGLLDSRRRADAAGAALRAVRARRRARPRAEVVLPRPDRRQARAARRRRAQYGADLRAVRGAGARGRRHGDRDRRDLRPHGGDRGPRRAQHRARRIPGARQRAGGGVPALPGGPSRDGVLTGADAFLPARGVA